AGGPLPAAGAAAGADAGPAAGGGAAVPRLRDAGADLDRGRPAAAAAAVDAAGAAGDRGDRRLLAVAGAVGARDRGGDGGRSQPQPAGRGPRAGALHRIAGRRRGLCRRDVDYLNLQEPDLRLPRGRRPARRHHRPPRLAELRRRGPLPAPGRRLPRGGPGRRRPRLPLDALWRQRPAAAPGRGNHGCRFRSRGDDHRRAARRSPARDHRPSALPDRAAAAGPGLRAAGGAAGPQFAAADPVRQRGDRLPCLPGGHGPDAAGYRLAGRGQAAARRRPVVAGAAVAGAGCVVLLRRWPTAAAASAQEPRMKPFPKIHDVYVGRVLLGTVLLTWAVLVGLDFVIGGLTPEFDDIG